jgi:16S rRNA (adenine1518-N6/adenine1519-N6)-dimethyltransferase
LINAKKSLGQNFLIDRRVARRIVEAVAPLPTDIILEIGPGMGALTTLMVERCADIRAVEIDPRLVAQLRRSLDSPCLTIIEGDAMKIDWEKLIGEALTAHKENPRVRVVANLPYYISTPIIERLLRARPRIHDMTLMLQKEVVARIISPPGGKEYGYLSVLAQYHCEAKKLFEVSPSAFKPAPKVRSAVLRLVIKDKQRFGAEDEKKFLAMVGAAFSQRRKTLLNNLKASGYGSVAAGLEPSLQSAGIDARRRAETLSVEEFKTIYLRLMGK